MQGLKWQRDKAQMRGLKGKTTKVINRLGRKLRLEEKAAGEVLVSKRSTGSVCCLKQTRTQIEQ